MLMAVNAAQVPHQSSSSASNQIPNYDPNQALQDALQRMVNSELMGGVGPTTTTSSGGNNRVGATTTTSRGGTGTGVNAVNGGRGRRMRVRNNNRLQNNVFENIVQDFLINVTGGGQAQAGGVPMFFVGNPEDYVYGRDGLDTIVTQLLNQIDGTGPPPLARDKIAEIPKVEVTPEQVAEKLQCSVCWENFILAETVQKLPCLVRVTFLQLAVILLIYLKKKNILAHFP